MDNPYKEMINTYAQASVDNMTIKDLTGIVYDMIVERLAGLDEDDGIDEIRCFAPELYEQYKDDLLWKKERESSVSGV